MDELGMTKSNYSCAMAEIDMILEHVVAYLNGEIPRQSLVNFIGWNFPRTVIKNDTVVKHVEAKSAYPHPGKVLLEAFLKPRRISPQELADDTGIPREHITEIIGGIRKIDTLNDFRLSHFLGLATGYFTRLQDKHDKFDTHQ